MEFFANFTWMVSLVLLQVLLFNNIQFSGYGVPLIYIYAILRFRSDINRSQLMVWGFAIGLLMDSFNNTPGMNAAALTSVAFFRPYLLKGISIHTHDDLYDVNMKTLNVGTYFLYVLYSTTLMCIILYSMEMIAYANIGMTLMKILSSIMTTVICIFIYEYIASRRSEH